MTTMRRDADWLALTVLFPEAVRQWKRQQSIRRTPNINPTRVMASEEHGDAVPVRTSWNPLRALRSWGRIEEQPDLEQPVRRFLSCFVWGVYTPFQTGQASVDCCVVVPIHRCIAFVKWACGVHILHRVLLSIKGTCILIRTQHDRLACCGCAGKARWCVEYPHDFDVQ